MLRKQDRQNFPEIGKAIRAARVKKGLSQAELAAEAKVSRRQVTLMEAGENTTLGFLERVLRVLQIRSIRMGSATAVVENPVKAEALRGNAVKLVEEIDAILSSMRFTAATPLSLIDAREEPNATRIRIRLADDEEPINARNVLPMKGNLSRRKAQPPVEDERRNRPRGRAAAGPNIIIETDDPESPVREIPMHYYHELGAREVFKVEGDSMIDIGITPEDLVFIRPTKDAKTGNGKVVVCKVDGHEFVKVLELTDSKIRLLSANASYDPMEVAPEEFEMVGVVVGRSGYVWMDGLRSRAEGE